MWYIFKQRKEPVMVYETSIAIEAPPEVVWAALMDVQGWPAYTDSITRVACVGGEVLALGARVRIEQPRMPALVWEVTEFHPGTAFVWRAQSPGVATIATHAIAAAPEGSTVTFGVRHTGVLARIVWALTGKRTRRYVGMESRGLKRRCEEPVLAGSGRSRPNDTQDAGSAA
jgi:hypothetical protein